MDFLRGLLIFLQDWSKHKVTLDIAHITDFYFVLRQLSQDLDVRIHPLKIKVFMLFPQTIEYLTHQA